MKEGKELINEILEYTGVKAPTLANNIGVLYSRIQNIQLGKAKKISLDLANKICAAYPEINKSYLLKGEGELLKSDSRNINVNHSPNANVAGNDILLGASGREKRAINALVEDENITKADLFEVIRHLQHMNDRHLATIEKLTAANDRLNAVVLQLLSQCADVLPNIEIKKIFNEISNHV